MVQLNSLRPHPEVRKPFVQRRAAASKDEGGLSHMNA